ncbi:hypothetical protein [Clostridium felsineum]|uniref:hypothetical protein n=1 Tax=Clostridium felsineum TaxID=36839 RepID=UPI00098C85BD|nr:hypothetical protein [Clostridium felsineum]URZ16190.1 hypothetical protein CLFE_022370 [Clostridium felsineum DSM 794]
MKADITPLLAVGSFFYGKLIEHDGCIFLKDNFSLERYNGWKTFLKNNKKIIKSNRKSYECV